MKKLIAYLLMTAILLSLSACKPANPGNGILEPNQMSIKKGQSFSAYEGIEVQISNAVWSEEGFVLHVDWINKTSYEGIFGRSYMIERKDGENWVSCQAVDEMVFPAIAEVLLPGQTRKETYNVSSLFDVAKAGTYRFRSDISVSDGSDKSNNQMVWVEFTIGNESGSDDGNAAGAELQWCAQYIRTNGDYEDVLFPCVRIIHSLQELRDYYTTWHESFDLERKDKVYSDTTIGFLDACDQYDEAFFEENYLIFVILQEGSGSIRHEVRSVTQTEDKLISISVDRNVPEVGTDDMAQWHIILELSRDVLVENSIDTMLFVEGQPAFMDDKVVVPPVESAFKKPPVATLHTPEGDTSLRAAGYSWFCQKSDGLMEAVIADQAGRPLPKESLKPVPISSQFAETVYAYVSPGKYEPTNALGYLVKMAWETAPSSVAITCWPDTVWTDSNTREETVVFEEAAFYAKHGGYIYEIAATWEDTGVGYHGTANYYVYIIGGQNHSHQAAATAQTVENPVTCTCGNTQTTLYIGDKTYSFMFGHSTTLTDILASLDYDPMQVCRCMSEYKVDTEFGLGYQINLTQGFTRCEKGQAALTQEQIDTIADIIQWAETTNCEY